MGDVIPLERRPKYDERYIEILEGVLALLDNFHRYLMDKNTDLACRNMWREWDDFNINPNICCASRMTQARLDLSMTHHLVRDKKISEFKKLSVFAWSKGKVEFCIDQTLEDYNITLVYDDSPEFIDDPDGGEEIPKIKIYILPQRRVTTWI